VMVFSASPFYETYGDAPRRLFGLSAVTDQKLAGVVMMLGQALAFAALVVVARPGVDDGLPGQVALRATFGLLGARALTSPSRVVAATSLFTAPALTAALGLHAMPTACGPAAPAPRLPWGRDCLWPGRTPPPPLPSPAGDRCGCRRYTDIGLLPPIEQRHAGSVTVSATAPAAPAQKPGHMAGQFWLLQGTHYEHLSDLILVRLQVHNTHMCCDQQQACATGS